MNDLIFDVCCLILYGSIFILLFGIINGLFEFACKHIPSFNTWINKIVGTDDDWEGEE